MCYSTCFLDYVYIICLTFWWVVSLFSLLFYVCSCQWVVEDPLCRNCILDIFGTLIAHTVQGYWWLLNLDWRFISTQVFKFHKDMWILLALPSVAYVWSICQFTVLRVMFLVSWLDFFSFSRINFSNEILQWTITYKRDKIGSAPLEMCCST